MHDYKINGVLGVSGSVLATLPGALTPDGIVQLVSIICSFFFFNDTATTEIYTLSLHDALPIYGGFLTYNIKKNIHQSSSE